MHTFQWNILFDFGKLVFADPTYGAYPVVGQIVKTCSGGNAVVRVAYFGIIFPLAHFTVVFVHSCQDFKSVYKSVVDEGCYIVFDSGDGAEIEFLAEHIENIGSEERRQSGAGVDIFDSEVE